MPDKTTQILKEIEAEFDSIKEVYSLSALKNYMMPRITQALAQQQQEDDQEIVEVIMSVDKGDRIVIRDDILKALAQKKGKVS